MAITIRYGRQLHIVRPAAAAPDDDLDWPDPQACFVGRGGSGPAHSVAVQLSRDERTMSRRVLAIDCPFDGFWRIRRTTEVNGVVVLTANGGRLPIESEWFRIPDAWGAIHVRVITPSAEFDFGVQPGELGHAPAAAPIDGNATTLVARGLQSSSAPKHLLTCVALCKPTLLDPHEDRVPSAQEVLDTLVHAGVDPIERKPARVQRRLEEVAGWLGIEPRTNRALRDRLVASRAVTREHLELLRAGDRAEQ